MDTSKLLAEWLAWKSAKDGERYTQKKLSLESGIAQSTISNIINGKSKPDNDTLQGIADAIGITISEFFVGPKHYGKARYYKDGDDEAVLFADPVTGEYHEDKMFGMLIDGLLFGRDKKNSRNSIRYSEGSIEFP